MPVTLIIADRGIYISHYKLQACMQLNYKQHVCRDRVVNRYSHKHIAVAIEIIRDTVSATNLLSFLLIFYSNSQFQQQINQLNQKTIIRKGYHFRYRCNFTRSGFVYATKVDEPKQYSRMAELTREKMRDALRHTLGLP